jgi:hypothetical protein
MAMSSAKTFRTTASLAIVVALVGCNLLKKGGADAGEDAAADAAVAEATDAAVVPEAGPVASNENDVARYPDETKIENVPATIQRTSYVREAPISGKPIVQVTKDQAVTEIGARGDYFLVVLDTGGKTLMGWVHKDSFTPMPAHQAIKTPTCKAPDFAVFADQPLCARPCTADANCAAGQVCKGQANKIVNGKVAEAIQICIAPPPAPDAGTTPPPPATTPDAAAPPPATPDAGKPATPPPPPPGAIVTDPPCGAGFIHVKKDNKCHKSCRSGVAACGNNACVKCEGNSVCTTVATKNTFCK